jgi:glycosyltransferase involved in cell wall biosynthesis
MEKSESVKNIKVLRILARLTGGPAKHVAWLGEGLARKTDTCLICGKIPESEDMGWYYDKKGLKRNFLKYMKREISIVSDFLNIIEILIWILRFKPDIVHTHTSKAGFNGRIAAFMANILRLIAFQKRIKVVHTFHGHTFHSYFHPLLEKAFLWIERILANLATDKILTLSKRLENEILLDYRVGKKEQYALVPLGIEMGFCESLQRAPYQEQFGFLENDFIFGTVGRITEIKNYELFIDAVNSMDSAKTLGGALAGDGDPVYVGSLKTRAGSNSNNRIRFLGMQSELEKVYGLFDCFVLTSKNEGTPVVMMEAFACGIPVVGTLVGGVVDLFGEVLEKKEGFVICERGIGVQPEDLDGLKSAMEYVSGNRSLLHPQVHAAKEYVFKNHSIENLCQNVLNVYHELL